MSALAVARRLVAEERLVRGIKTPEARNIIAREAGITPGSLENLERGRLKRTGWIAERLNGLLGRKLEQRIASLQHEFILLQACGRARKIDVDRVDAALAEARRALGKE